MDGDKGLGSAIPLARQSSFERFIENLEKQQKNLSLSACIKIQDLWRALRSYKSTRANVLKLLNEDVFTVQSFLTQCSQSLSFASCQEIVMNGNFIRCIQSFLTRYNLSSSTKNSLRDAKLIASAILIKYFPRDILQDDGMETETLSTDSEVVNCVNSSKLVVFTLHRTLKSIINIQNSPMRYSVGKYTASQSGYIAAFANFTKHLDVWKQYDKARIAQQLEFSFIQSYSLYLSTKQIPDEVSGDSYDFAKSPGKKEMTDSPSKLRTSAVQQIEKIKAAYKAIVGNAKAEARFEELAAMVEASISNLQTSEESTQTPEKDLITSSASSKVNSPTSSAIVNEPAFVSPTASNVTAPTLPLEQQNLLIKLELTGLDTDKLIYEILYDPTYQISEEKSLDNQSLQYAAATSSPTDDENQTTVERFARKIRDRMLYMMNDRLVWSLKRSPIANVKSDLAVTMVIPIALPPSSTIAQGLVVYDSARVTSIYDSSVDVTYLSDNSMERNVSFDRIKLADMPPQPELFLGSLRDLISRVASLTPNRRDFSDRLNEALDEPLYIQMILNNAINPEDCIKLFYYIYTCIVKLQAPVRSEVSKQWWKGYIEDVRSKASWQDFISSIPSYFTQTAFMIDEIHRDMSNYYISTLAPSLSSSGPMYLSQRFMYRLTNPESMRQGVESALYMRSLDATASLLFAQVNPKENLKATMDDLIECGYNAPYTTSDEALYTRMISDETGMKAITARALVQLLAVPFRLNSQQAIQHILPEVLYFDANRLAELRDIIDKISLQGVLNITARQIIGKLGRSQASASGSNQSEHIYLFMSRLDVFLSSGDVSITHIATELLRHVTTVTGVSKNVNIDNMLLDDYVKKSVAEVIKARNPVLQLLFKRIGKLILRALLGLRYSDKLAEYSLNIPGLNKNIDSLMESATRLFQNNWTVYGNIYIMIFMSQDFQMRLEQSNA